jgi:uncharacterized protein YbaR (Trm112 family)
MTSAPEIGKKWWIWKNPERITNLQILLSGIVVSIVTFTLLIIWVTVWIQPYQSSSTSWTLAPYEAEILPLTRPPFVCKRKVTIVRAPTTLPLSIYWTPTKSCPELENVESEVHRETIDVRHRGRSQKDFFLPLHSTLTLHTLQVKGGDIDIRIFANWKDERDYERQIKTPNTEVLIDASVAKANVNPKKNVDLQVISKHSDYFVIIFQGLSGQSVDMICTITRRRYPVKNLIPFLVKPEIRNSTSHSISSEEIGLPVKAAAGCWIIESIESTQDITLQLKIQNTPKWAWIVGISFLPLVMVLIYIKFHPKFVLDRRPIQQSTLHLVSGYEMLDMDPQGVI